MSETVGQIGVSVTRSEGLHFREAAFSLEGEGLHIEASLGVPPAYFYVAIDREGEPRAQYVVSLSALAQEILVLHERRTEKDQK